MFASKDLFDDDGVDIDVDARHMPSSQQSRPMTATSSSSPTPLYTSSSTYDAPSSGNFASSVSGVGQLSDLPSTPTPAMRKQKMEEMRRAQLDKRKQKAMAAPTVLRSNQDQIKSPTSAASPQASPAFQRHQPSSSPTYQRQPSASSSMAASASPRALTDQLNDLSSGESDDERASSAVDVVHDDGHLSGLLAEKMKMREMKNVHRVERGMMEQGIAPVFDPVKPLSPGAQLDFSDMRSFLLMPIPKGTTFQCYILRNKKGLKNKLYPTYEAYVSGEERFLLAAKKRTKNKTSNYMISMDKNNVGGKESASYLGKVRSNFVGTEFVGYDKGINPSDLDAESASISMMSVRQELCAVFYESNILGSKGPRKMTAVVPSVRKDGYKSVWKPMTPEESIAVRYKHDPNSPEFMSLVNKTPKWNDQVGAYVLNFNGRVTCPSVKNFQLIHLDDPENVILQFGRIGKDTFTMDCLEVGTLVAVYGSTPIAVEKITAGRQLVGQDSEPVTVLYPPVIGESASMIAIEHAFGGQSVTPNHLVTLRWNKNPTVEFRTVGSAEIPARLRRAESEDQKDEEDEKHEVGEKNEEALGNSFMHYRISWFDASTPTTVKSKSWRVPTEGCSDPKASKKHEKQADIKEAVVDQQSWLPYSLAPYMREFSHWWLEKAESVGLYRPLRAGDLIDVPAERLLEYSKKEAFLSNVSIPMVRLPGPTHDSKAQLAAALEAGESSLSFPLAAAAAASELPVDQVKDKSMETQAEMGEDEEEVQEKGDNVDEEAWVQEFCALYGLDYSPPPVAESVYTLDVQPKSDSSEGTVESSGAISAQHMEVLQSAVAAAKELKFSVTVAEQLNRGVDSDDSNFGPKKVVFQQTKVGDEINVVYMLHNPSSPDTIFNAKGEVSFSIKQLEAVWQEWNLDAASLGIMIAELNPMTAQTGELDSRLNAHDAVCLATMSAAIATLRAPRGKAASLSPAPVHGKIIAFDMYAKDQWMANYAKLPGLTSSSWRRLEQDVSFAILELQFDLDRVSVYFSPHPSAWWKYDRLLQTIAVAHGAKWTEDALTKKMASMKLLSSVEKVERVRGAKYVAVEVSGEKRYVLADGSLTHNCKYPLSPLQAFEICLTSFDYKFACE